MKRKMIYTVSMLLILITLLAGCASAPEALEGSWSCDETASDGETYTGFYALEVQKNGSFSMYDREAGNPGISGKMKDTGEGTSHAVLIQTISIRRLAGENSKKKTHCSTKHQATTG